jgi:hypothetical protein
MANPLARLAVRAVAAAASRQIASRVSGAQLGPLGNAAALALPFVLRRVSPLGMVAMAAGAWGLGRLAQSSAPVAESPVPQPDQTPMCTPPPPALNSAGDKT